MIKQFLILLPLLMPVLAHSSCNLREQDYAGEYTSDWVAVKGEKQALRINGDHSSEFVRTFEAGDSQRFQSKSFQLVEDVLIIKYFKESGALAYKLILSGWKIDEIKALYGTMYMYRDGKQYNGLPVSFRSK